MNEKHEQRLELPPLRADFLANSEAWKAMPVDVAKNCFSRVKIAFFEVANAYMTLANAMASEYHHLSRKSAGGLCVRFVEADKALRQELKRLTKTKPPKRQSTTPSAASPK